MKSPFARTEAPGVLTDFRYLEPQCPLAVVASPAIPVDRPQRDPRQLTIYQQ